MHLRANSMELSPIPLSLEGRGFAFCLLCRQPGDVSTLAELEAS